MSQKKKINYESRETTIDQTTGEILMKTTTTKALVEREPDYIKLYLNDLMKIKELPKNTNIILIAILKLMSWNNIFAAYAPIKNVICSELGIAIDTLNKGIQNLYKKGILIRVARGVYLVDPELVGKGKWEDIKKLRMIIDYNQDGTKTVKTERANQLQINFSKNKNNPIIEE